MSLGKLVWAMAILPLAGCLTSAEPIEPVNWTIAVAEKLGVRNVSESEEGDSAKGTVRVSQVSVRAPYDTRQFAILRADGSIAFDAYNQFASSPAALVKSAALDVMNSSEAFRAVVASSSAVRSELSAEITIDTLALDCRTEDERKALVALSLIIVKDREIFASASGSATCDAADGDYSAAFSSAFASAMAKAMSEL